MKRSHLPIILLSLLLASCGGASAHAQPGQPAFVVITKNPDDQVGIQYENATALIDIQSPTGIGSATFELDSGDMPGEMILRLHLHGLEQVRFNSAQDRIAASVSSSDPFNVSDQRILSAGEEIPLLPGHPLWMEIEVVSELAEKTIPLEEGYFEIRVPRKFIEQAGNSFEIEWIDFYR
jgi:hypothetical protein